MILQPENITYWFQVWSKDLNPDTNKPFFFSERILKKDSTSFIDIDVPESTNAITVFNVEEEEYLATIVNLTIRDEVGLLLETFKIGKVFYYRYGFIEEGLFDEIKEVFSDEINIKSYRGGKHDDPLTEKYGILCYVTNFPKFKMEGTVCEFMVNLRAGFTYQRFPVTFTYKSGTIKDMIVTICKEELRMDDYIVDFDDMNDSLTDKNPITRLSKTPTSFLKELASKYNLRLVYNFDNGKRYLIMVDWDKKELVQEYLNKFRKTTGKYHYLDYGHAKANLLSIEGSIEPGQLGSVAIPTISPDGKPSMQFLPSGQITTTMWVFDPEYTRQKLKSEYATTKGKERIDKLEEDIKSSNDIKDFFLDTGKPLPKYEEFFRPHTDTSAPESGGVIVEVSTIPNPVYWIADLVWLGSNPDKLVEESDSFYFKSKSTIPFIFQSREGDMQKTEPSQNSIPVKSKVSASKYTTYRISKMSWTHDSTGVSQKIRLKR